MQQDNNHMVLTVMAGFDGGLIVYDGSNGSSRLVFGGNIDEASKYLTDRMNKLLSEPPKQPLKMLDELLREDDGAAERHPVQAYAAGRKAAAPADALRAAMDAVSAADDGE